MSLIRRGARSFPAPAMTGSLADEAGEALKLAGSDAARAAALATTIVVRAKAVRDHAAWSIAERAWGLASYHNEDVDAALSHLRVAISHARRHGSAQLAAQARMTLAFVQTARGRSRQGLREIETALTDLHGIDRMHGEVQRAGILLLLGRLDEALAGYSAVLPAVRAAGDETWLWRTLSNRAVVHGQRRELAAAEADLLEAAAVCERLRLANPAAYVQQNLGWVASLAGDVPAALRYLDEAERRLRDLRLQLGEVLRDRAELLLSVYLVAEARAAATHAVAELEREHRLNVLPEARLLLARAATLDDKPALALEHARRATHEFRRQGRADWLAAARLAVLTARVALGSRPSVSLRELADVADTLEAARWSAAVAESHVLAGAVALERGRVLVACQHWDRASHLRDRGPATVRARAWYATAMRRLNTGDSRGASRATRAGLRIVDEYQVTMGATDLRARAAGHRTDLAQLGLRLAFASGRPSRVLEWAERGRASLLRLRPVRPPEDPTLQAALAELRATVSEAVELRRDGRPNARTVTQQAMLERHVRDLFRRRHGGAELTEPVPPHRLAARLGAASLVEFVDYDEYLYALTLNHRGLRLHRLTRRTVLSDLLDRIPFALRRISQPRSTEESRAAAMLMLHNATTRLDTALLHPIAVELADSPLVLVPTGRLQSVPWSILPSCTGRPTVIAPSATAWHQADQARPAELERTAAVAVIVGPDLPGAHDEAARVATLYEVEPLSGDRATADAALDVLRSKDLVHIAAHGHLSTENPLFSSLSLADGPLMLYDLEGLERTPATVVLAACDSGRYIVYPGDEVLGLAATFLAHGTRQFVGSVIPVPDIETASLMVEFHRLLAAGGTAAEALARTQRQAIEEGGVALAAAVAFVCVGADAPVRNPPPGRRNTVASDHDRRQEAIRVGARSPATTMSCDEK
jgi:tetratricopeptide (TPR) repeat protein